MSLFFRHILPLGTIIFGLIMGYSLPVILGVGVLAVWGNVYMAIAFALVVDIWWGAPTGLLAFTSLPILLSTGGIIAVRALLSAYVLDRQFQERL